MKTYLIVGLGNPGKDYSKTRHNAGFLLVDCIFDKFRDEQQLTWQNSNNLEANTSKIVTNDIKIVLLKPLTFMNDSGRSVNKSLKWLEIDSTDNLIVAHDDLDLQLGEFKIQKGKGPKAHNGINSIVSNINSEDFTRIRLGIDNRISRNEVGKDYVLGKFSKDETSKLQDNFDVIYTEILKLLI